MTFSEYQKESRKTAVYPRGIIYPALGLGGEAGEVLEKIKKIIRDREGKVDAEVLEKISKELGDVLWYIAQLCTELGLDMEEVARKNLEKLFSRKERGVLKGEGDER
ncbi:MAG: nucleoside triphosphate pyrophosphohydrolase family protein [Candidatus Micrarchaeota archaeon]|nr:nucleoside triphosphate pyrophosphohydrolase family protein [Candidatus Micrarchaeota archaeon]